MFGYHPFGNWQTVKLFVCLTTTEASELTRNFGEYLQIFNLHPKEDNSKPKFKIIGALPSGVFYKAWIPAFKLAKLRSARDFADSAVLREQALQDGDFVPASPNWLTSEENEFIRASDDLPF